MNKKAAYFKGLPLFSSWFSLILRGFDPAHRIRVVWGRGPWA
jgi:hypothetical protein